MKILIDTNIVIDILERREPFFTSSYNALRRALINDSECLVTASSVTDIFYILRKFLRSADRAKLCVRQLSQLVTFADVQALDIQTALMSSMPDFEDAVADAVARRYRAVCIVTRNKKDFTGSFVQALTPEEYLGRY